MKKVKLQTTISNLSEILYGDTDTLEDFNKQKCNELIKDHAQALTRIYENIDNENYDFSPSDLYALGDIINLLENLIL